MRPICAMAVCHKDIEQAKLWLHWVSWLAGRYTEEDNILVILVSQKANCVGALAEYVGSMKDGMFRTKISVCPDQDESGYPRSASHLFLRTLEHCEKEFPGRPILWCEPDTVPLKPDWFTDLCSQYQACGRAFMGERIMHQGGKRSHMTGNGFYPADWRILAPSIATVLQAPDTALWGPNHGQPWDVWAADETVADLHETESIQQIFTGPPWTSANLSRLREGASLFHRCKDGTLVVQIARRDHPGFLAALPEPSLFFGMTGHPSRLRTLGYEVGDWSAAHRGPTGWFSVCRPRDAADELVLQCLVGSKGISRITEVEYRTALER